MIYILSVFAALIAFYIYCRVRARRDAYGIAWKTSCCSTTFLTGLMKGKPIMTDTPPRRNDYVNTSKSAGQDRQKTLRCPNPSHHDEHPSAHLYDERVFSRVFRVMGCFRRRGPP
jgi:hypothetical protein